MSKNIGDFDPYSVRVYDFFSRVYEWKTRDSVTVLCECARGSREENQRQAELIASAMNRSRRAYQISAIVMFEKRMLESRKKGEWDIALAYEREATRLRLRIYD